MTQFAKPSTDTTVSGWSASSGSFLFNCINEGVASASDETVVQTGFAPNAAVYVTKVSGAVDPNVDTGHVIAVRGGENGLGNVLTLTCSLYESYVSEGAKGTLIQTFMTSSFPRPSGTFRTDNFAVAPASAALITDYTSLFVRMEVSST